MRFLISVAAATALLLSGPAGAFDAKADAQAEAKRLAGLHYNNYLYCQAYMLEVADSLKRAGKDDSTPLANAAGFEDGAKAYQEHLKISDTDAAGRLQDARLEIYTRAESLDEAAFKIFDEKMTAHCVGVAAEDDELEVELTW